MTREVLSGVPDLGEVEIGLLHLLIRHTSASLTLNENASPDVRRDFESWFSDAVPERSALWTHTLEGPDDMPAHVKASLLGPTLTLPVRDGRLVLGTWQGIYLCEHRDRGGPRSLTATLWGERRGVSDFDVVGASVRAVCERMFVRWDDQQLSEEGRRTLPGYREPAAIRTFDAPEALDTRFYEVRAKSALNKVPERSRMPFRWTVNPYRGCSHACTYCFARPTHKYLDLNAGRDFEREIVVKVNVPEVLRAELKRPSWRREHVAMGTNTDPYQWVEGRYELMPGIWEALRDSGTPASVLTKSPLLLRDIELMKSVPGISANLSVPTLDEKAWRATEPRTPHPRARLEAVAELVAAGHPVRDPDRAADAGHQRLARAGRADPRARRRGGCHQHRRHRPAPPGRGQGHLLRLAALAAAGPRASL